MSPEQLLEQLKTGANARKVKSLDILNSICQEQFERGSKDFSIATIGRLSEKKGGPATQSIRNKTGGDFKAIISVWANHTGGSMKRQPKLNDNPLYAILLKITDPAVRAVVGSVLAENKKLRGEVNLLKHNVQFVIDKRETKFTYGETHQAFQILPTFNNLTEYEMEALRHAISDTLMSDEGWKTDGSGRVMNLHGRVILKAGFVIAIQKVLGILERSPEK